MVARATRILNVLILIINANIITSSEIELYEKSQPIFVDGCYDNPWPTWKGFPDVFALAQTKYRSRKLRPSEIDLSDELRVIKPIFKPNPKRGLIVTWLGHSTVLIQMEGKAFLTDPNFAERSSPVYFYGPKRLKPPPCSINDLPQIDAIIISHNHYDHLDYETVVQLNERFGEKLTWYVPAKLKSWVDTVGCTNVIEKSWWEEEMVINSTIKIVALPAQHWSTRTGLDRNKSLWCSWALKGQHVSFYFTGDTGYCPEFKTIGHYYGPFTFAAIPIGCYKPRWFMKSIHIDPGEAVQIHKDIGANYSLGIHWGTYEMGTMEGIYEPKRKLAHEVLKANLSSNSFFTLQIGESWENIV